MTIPNIETDRLILRRHTLDDFEPLAAMWGDPLVARFIGGKPATREESWVRLLRYSGHWELMGFGYWAVELKGGASYIGDAGFADWKRDITPSIEGTPESGWAFSPAAHGRGIATEAVQAVLEWGDRHFGGKTTCCIIKPDNLASIRVAQKCGYSEYVRTEFKGSPTIQFRRVAVA